MGTLWGSSAENDRHNALDPEGDDERYSGPAPSTRLGSLPSPLCFTPAGDGCGGASGAAQAVGPVGLRAWLDRRRSDVAGWFRPSLMWDVGAALLLYGGGWMPDYMWFGRREVRRLFGWARLPGPSTFRRCLRRAGAPAEEVLEELIRRIVRLRWERRGARASATLVLDSTVILRYGTE